MSEIDGLGRLLLEIGLLIAIEFSTDLVLLVVEEVVLSVLPLSEVLIDGILYPPVNAQELAK